ncbi:MAG: hypothetical protein ACKO4T_02865 [Planctomycetaceae bacterium]
MQFITIGLVTALSALLSFGSSANASTVPGTILVADIGTPSGSLAWAGENESFAGLELAPLSRMPEGEVDAKFVTGLAAPEPPAIVLAGMALGGVICGRSFLRKRPKASTKETT